MTHIVTNGQYLIADKRTNFTSGTGGDHSGRKPGTRRARFFRDDAVKITVLDNPQKLVFVDPPEAKGPRLRVVAVGLSGSTTSALRHPVLTLQMVGNLVDYAKLLQADVFQENVFTLLALTEDGSAFVLKDITQNGSVYWKLFRTTPKQFADGEFVAIGSGTQHRFLETAYAKKEITLMEAFFYGSHRDMVSTTDYSVFGLQENHLFTTVRPKEEEVRDAYNKVHTLLAFNKAKRRALPSSYDLS